MREAELKMREAGLEMREAGLEMREARLEMLYNGLSQCKEYLDLLTKEVYFS